MKKIKLAAVLTALTLAVSMTACGSSETSESDYNNEPTTDLREVSGGNTTRNKGNSYEISYADQTAKVHKLDGLTNWNTGEFTRSKEQAHYVYCYSPLFYCCFNIYDENKARKLIENNKLDGMKTGTIENNGKTVSYSIGYVLEDEKIFDRMTLHLPVGNGYVKEIGVSAGGTIKRKNKEKDESDADYFRKNLEKYSALSDDPEDYLYLFEAFDV